MIQRADLVAGVSLATGWFLIVLDHAWKWRDFAYLSSAYPSPKLAESILVLNVLVLGVCFAGVFAACRRSRLAVIVLAYLLFVPLRQAIFMWIEPHLGRQFQWMPVRALQLTLLALVVASIVGKLDLARVRTALLIASPLLPLVLFNLWLRHPTTGSHEKSPAPPVAASPRRVVWLIFDELDEGLAHSHRPPGLTLPELDRLRSESIQAERAIPPGLYTRISIPSLLTGRPLSDAQPLQADDMKLTFADGSSGRWTQTTTIFQRLQQLGVATAVAGWYHPYCRVVGSAVAECLSWPLFPPAPVRDSGYQVASSQWRSIAPFLPLSRFLVAPESDQKERQWSAQMVREIEASAAALVGNRQYGLVYVHLSVPHLPAVYDRRTGRLGETASGNYLDNLQLADLVLGKIRKSMEAAGTWDSSLVVLSSDHPLRVFFWHDRPEWTAEEQKVTGGRTSPYVPWLIKLPGQTSPLTLKPSIPTLLTHDMILEYLRGSLDTPEALAAWLVSNRTRWGEPRIPDLTSIPDEMRAPPASVTSTLDRHSHGSDF